MTDRDPSSLPDSLDAAVNDPLPPSLWGTPVYEWLTDVLPGRFPLLSFQAVVYADLQEGELPITYPLRAIASSIREDDGISPEESVHLDPPLATLDRRRAWLAGTSEEVPWGVVSDEGEWIDEDDEGPRLRGGTVQFVGLPSLYDPDEQVGSHCVPAADNAEEIGERLANLLDELETARGSGDEDRKEEVEAELDRFLRSLGVRGGGNVPGYGRPREGPTPLLVQRLFEEVRLLFKLCWELWPFDPSERTRAVLAEHGIEEEDCGLWATNLALPVLSTVEVRAVAEQIPIARGEEAGPTNPTPRRLAVWILSHRLSMAPTSLSAAIWPRSGGATQEFDRQPNPLPLRSGS